MEKQNYPAGDDQSAAGIAHSERTHRLRKALKDYPSQKLTIADRVAVAEALYRLMQRLEGEHGIPKEKVLREARIGGEGDSTKHMSQYAIRPGSNPDRLRKKVGVYAKLAAEAARLARLDETEVLLEVFNQAGFWQTVIMRQASAEFVELAQRLRFVMNGVAREQGLMDFFQAVEKGGGILTPRADCWPRKQEASRLLTPQEVAVEFDFAWGPQFWPVEFYQPTEEAEDGNGDHIPVYPSLILGAWRLDNPFPVSVTVEMTAADDSMHTVSGTVNGEHELEMRLCIVPTGKTMEATPALRVQMNTALSPLMTPSPASEETPTLTFPWATMPVLKRGRSKVFGRSPEVNKDFLCEVYVRDDVIPQLFKDYFVDLVSSRSGQPAIATGARFLPITGAVCEDWFGFAPSKNHYDPIQQRIAARAQGNPIADLFLEHEFPAAEFRSDTLANTIHNCLCDGSDGLDIRLRDHAELLRDTYAAARSLGLRQRQEGWDRVKQRWAAPSGSSKK